MTLLLTAARAHAASLEAQVGQLSADIADEIAHAARHKTPVGNHYWQDRHDAELRLRAARALVEALIDG